MYLCPYCKITAPSFFSCLALYIYIIPELNYSLENLLIFIHIIAFIIPFSQNKLPLPTRCSSHLVKPSSSFKTPVLVSCGYYNRFPQTGWLRATEIYPLTILAARSPKSRGQHICTPSEGSRGICFLPLPASGDCWHC